MLPGFLVHRGFISQSPELHNYRSEFWYHTEFANLCSLGPCRALRICGETDQMLLWSCCALPLALGALQLISCYSGECIRLALLRGLQVAQVCGRHSQGLSSFLWAGSSLYLASCALKHWLLAGAKGQSPKMKKSMVWSVLRKGFKYSSFCGIQRELSVQDSETKPEFFH